MASPFDALTLAAGAVVTAVFGEALTLTARTRGADADARPVPDPARPALTLTGEFNEPSRVERPGGRGIASTAVHGMVQQGPTVTLQGPLAWHPRRGDQVTRLKTGQSYEVAEAHFASHGIVRLELLG